MANNQARDWEAVVQGIYEDIPAAQDVDWARLFRDDPKILGALINDIIKVAVSERGRPGKRRARSAQEVSGDLLKLSQVDYAEVPFVEALRGLMAGRSIRQIARLSGLDKMTVSRLYEGKGWPATPCHMEALAKAFRKDPSFFMEYRALYVCQALYDMLLESGESSAVFYNKVKNVDV